MVSTGYSDYGEEWAQKFAWRQDTLGTRDTTATVLLYDDSTDSITDSDDIGSVTTELSGGNYVRATFNLDSSDVTVSTNTSDNLRINAQVTFDLTSTTGTFDAAMVLLDFQSDVVNSETGQNPHHIFSTGIGTFDASNFASGFDVSLNLDLN